VGSDSHGVTQRYEKVALSRPRAGGHVDRRVQAPVSVLRDGGQSHNHTGRRSPSAPHRCTRVATTRVAERRREAQPSSDAAVRRWQRARGNLTARERMSLLLDDGSFVDGALDDTFPLRAVGGMDAAWGHKNESIFYITEAHICRNQIAQATLRAADWVQQCL
jgi:hypothetical protein